MMISVFALMLAAADVAPERPAAPYGGVKVHRDGGKVPKAPADKAEPSATSVKVHKDKVPQSVKPEAAPEPEISEYHDDPVFSADIAFQRCIERAADAAAMANVPFEEFKAALPNLCTAEETRLAQRFADSRADDNAMKQVAGVPRSKSRALVFDYTEGLREVAKAGYLNLVKSRTPMRLEASLANRKPD